jgi:hypothetical protein
VEKTTPARYQGATVVHRSTHPVRKVTECHGSYDGEGTGTCKRPDVRSIRECARASATSPAGSATHKMD